MHNVKLTSIIVWPQIVGIAGKPRVELKELQIQKKL